MAEAPTVVDNIQKDMLLKAINKDLYGLLMRVKAVYAICGGGNDSIKVDKKTMRDFDYKKTMLIQRLFQLEEMAVAKGAIEKSMGGATTRDTIRMKLQMDSDLGAVEGELKALGSIAAADDGKGKLSAAELTARKEILETLKTEYYKVYERVSGHKHRGDKSFEQGGVGMPTLSKDALMKGAFAGAGVKVEREALTGEHYQALQMINAERAAQDAVLEEMSKVLDDLKDVAETIGDELTLQEKQIADLDKKTDKTQGKLDKVNDRAKHAVAKMNDKSTNCCMYLICLAILGALAVIAYRFIATKK